MSALIILDKYLEDYRMSGTMIQDKSIDELPFLSGREAIYNLKGEKISKSYHAPNGMECVRLVYSKVFETYVHNGIEYPDTWVGFKDEIHYFRWDYTETIIKYMQPYYFDLKPVFLGDGTETLVGFSSQKLRRTLRDERYKADDYLQAQNPDLYAMLFNRYTSAYEYYLKTGKKQNLVDAINAEIDATINAVFDNLVYGTEITVRNLILMNLQG